MGGPSQPYMYDRPSRQSVTADSLYGFNPRAVTQASRASAPQPAPKQDGPLINFNRHPDSWLILPYEPTEAKPVKNRTKGLIKGTRWTQFGFRVLQLIGAVGMLICVICIHGTQDTEGWILRIPSAVDILVSFYAIYHLFRPAQGRTPASSASYHFFALFMDAGLIPFYIFAAMMAEQNWSEQPGSNGRWRTFFSSDDATNKLLFTTWLDSIAVGGLHLISLALDLYLILVFRKIARLPPDMNPLEDNLTSRRSTKHKHKNSSLSGISVSEKRISDLNGSTISLSNPSRLSQAQDPLIPDARTMPFLHTRYDSDEGYSPHNPRSARASQTNLIYQQAHSARASRADVHSQSHSRNHSRSHSHSRSRSHSRARSKSRSPSKSPHPPMPANASTTSLPPYTSPSRTPNRSPVREGPNPSSLKSDNWFVHPSEDSYHPLPRYSFEADDDGAARTHHGYAEEEAAATAAYASLKPRPLRMNPPTPSPSNSPVKSSFPKTQREEVEMQRQSMPPMPSFRSAVGSVSEASEGIGRALTTTSRASAWSYAGDGLGREPSIGKPKGRYYGDLRAATQGVRSPQQGYQQQPGRTGASPERKGYQRVEGSPRVVSRTGVDVDGGDGDLGLGRREVSGKMAEEGRGGVKMPKWAGLVQRKVSGVA
ncbi:hypothetical protein K490DRAFT_55172 [Saccharata proteae CBS 121410]|uniref:Uncharacterized protein n=1 Tax=Saccharata proteae CBS 121410 TaxID=1314787 RepID=A0A6A5YD19_9PEZI|nr:hypothetical protein K490DRAFT_55172 [Saccharata proteae CBS 121410]